MCSVKTEARCGACVHVATSIIPLITCGLMRPAWYVGTKVEYDELSSNSGHLLLYFLYLQNIFNSQS
jgi:hypothetical protein